MNGKIEFRNQRISSSVSNSDFDLSFKVMIIGDSGVGKTCLLVRYKDGSFLDGNFISTVGIDFKNKIVSVDEKKIKLQIWDTAGQERFRSVTHNFFRDASALLLVYDICNPQSFANVANWIADAKRYAPSDATLVMIGNKCDCTSQRKFVLPVNNSHANLVVCLQRICDIPLPISSTTIVIFVVIAHRSNEMPDLISRRKAVRKFHNVDVQVRFQDGERLAREYNIVFLETSARNGTNVDLAFDAVAREVYRKSLTPTGMVHSDNETFNLKSYIASERKRTSCC